MTGLTTVLVQVHAHHLRFDTGVIHARGRSWRTSFPKISDHVEAAKARQACAVGRFVVTELLERGSGVPRPLASKVKRLVKVIDQALEGENIPSVTGYKRGCEVEVSVLGMELSRNAQFQLPSPSPLLLRCSNYWIHRWD